MFGKLSTSRGFQSQTLDPPGLQPGCSVQRPPWCQAPAETPWMSHCFFEGPLGRLPFDGKPGCADDSRGKEGVLGEISPTSCPMPGLSLYHISHTPSASMPPTPKHPSDLQTTPHPHSLPKHLQAAHAISRLKIIPHFELNLTSWSWLCSPWLHGTSWLPLSCSTQVFSPG